jgi:hypothetical protein
MSRDRCKGWITKGILISCRHKRDLYLLRKTTNNTLLLHRYYKKYCKTLTSTIQLAKKLHYNKLISESTDKTKTAWSVIHSLTNRRVRNNERTMLNIDGKIVQNPQTLAETFNKYFSHTVEESVIKTMKQNENDPYIQPHLNYIVDAYPKPIPPIQWKPVTKKELVDISNSLKGKKSYGYDEIPSWIVKLSMPLVIAPLIYICNKMLFTGTFPIG